MEKLNDICKILVIFMIYLSYIALLIMSMYSVVCMPSEAIAGIIIVFIALINLSLVICVMSDKSNF